MSVYRAKKKNGQVNKSWTAALDLGLDSKGKRKRVVRTAPTKRQAIEILRELERTYLGSSESIDVHTTLGDYVRSWFEIKVRGVRREKTASSYFYALDHYIIPALGKKRLVDITTTDIARRLSALGEEGLSAATRRQIRVVLHKAFNDAVADGKIFKNPVTAVPTPRANESETGLSAHKVFTRGEALEFCRALKGERIEAICLIAVTMGLRFGEVIGLKWEDIDRESETLQVRRTLGDVRVVFSDGSTKVKLISNPPKTVHGNRRLIMTRLASDGLKRWRSVQSQDRLLLGEAWQDTGYVFTSPKGQPLWQSNVRKRFKKVLRNNNLPNIRFHDLRHTAVVLMLEADARIEHVTEALGHSSIAITKDIYASSVPVLADRAIEAIDGYLNEDVVIPTRIAVSASPQIKNY